MIPFRQRDRLSRWAANVRAWNAVIGLTALFGIAWIWWSAEPDAALERIPNPHAGFPAPEFSLGSSSGEEISLSALRGQVVLVNFWASWCAPCRKEMPALQSVYEARAEDGLVILGVNATSQDSRAAALDFAASMGLSFPILFDIDGAVGRLYRVQALPTTFIIGRDGVIQDVLVGGPLPAAVLAEAVEALLEEGS